MLRSSRSTQSTSPPSGISVVPGFLVLPNIAATPALASSETSAMQGARCQTHMAQSRYPALVFPRRLSTFSRSRALPNNVLITACLLTFKRAARSSSCLNLPGVLLERREPEAPMVGGDFMARNCVREGSGQFRPVNAPSGQNTALLHHRFAVEEAATRWQEDIHQEKRGRFRRLSCACQISTRRSWLF